MARSTATIKAGIMSTIAADPLLGSLLTSTSLTSLFGLMAYVMAACQNLLEQSWDDYLAQITTYSQNTPAASLNWVASQAFLFQYDPSGNSATNDLVILNNGALGYATVDPQFNIVTRCAAITIGNNNAQIKVAQAGSPGSIISGAAYTQLQSYFDAKGTAGINYEVVSYDADLLYLEGTVYYKTGFATVVQQNVVDALNLYLDTIAIYSIGSSEPIDYQGIIKVSEIVDAIKNADGVYDVLLSRISYRPATSTNVSDGTVIYDLTVANGNYLSGILLAGYAKQESISGKGWLDKLNFSAAL
ncbi:MAG TPA: hypothetical protein VN698_04835 [Bacteroidia bacterium]|nr:hypothetical protein [Bacteroidia bacterium]